MMMQQGDTAWLDLRASCAITWSEASSALGIGYDSRQQYMKRKLGMVPPKEQNWRMAAGVEREPWAAEKYYELFRHHLDTPVTLWTDPFRKDWQDQRLGGSADRIVFDAHGDSWLLEIKTTPEADLRSEIPVGHLIQMHGLCHTYKLSKAHYFCWSMSQGFLLAEITFKDELWNELLYPLYKEFADWWAVRHVPKERISAEYKTALADDIRALCKITACKEVQMLAPLPTQ